MSLIEFWRGRSVAVRYVLFTATLAVVILLSVLTVRLFKAKAADDCNKPPAPVEVPQAPPGLIVDAPCTDPSAPAKTERSKGK
jgi:hypothetical protein